MRFKSFEIREYIGINAKGAKYEVVKWSETSEGKPFCWVVAFIRWNDKEPCWQFDVVGTRFIDDYENGLCEFIKKYLELADVIRENSEETDD